MTYMPIEPDLILDVLKELELSINSQREDLNYIRDRIMIISSTLGREAHEIDRLNGKLIRTEGTLKLIADRRKKK